MIMKSESVPQGSTSQNNSILDVSAAETNNPFEAKKDLYRTNARVTLPSKLPPEGEFSKDEISVVHSPKNEKP